MSTCYPPIFELADDFKPIPLLVKQSGLGCDLSGELPQDQAPVIVNPLGRSKCALFQLETLESLGMTQSGRVLANELIADCVAEVQGPDLVGTGDQLYPRTGDNSQSPSAKLQRRVVSRIEEGLAHTFPTFWSCICQTMPFCRRLTLQIKHRVEDLFRRLHGYDGSAQCRRCRHLLNRARSPERTDKALSRLAATRGG